MVSASVKLKDNASTYIEYFNALPTWECLTSRIAERFHIPTQDIAVGYLDKAEDSVTLTHNQGLQEYYKSLDQSSQVKFVVLDRQTPDPRTTIISSWASDSDLYALSNSVSLFCRVLSTSETEFFSVNIGKGDTVDDLKKKMKNDQERTFSGIDSGALRLWKLSPPIPSADEATLKGVERPEEVMGCIKLNPADEIKMHFSSPPTAHIHILVQRPTRSRKRSRSPEEAQASKKIPRWPDGIDHHSLFNSSDLPSKKHRLSSPEPPECSYNLSKWDLLWHTFWGNPAPQCFGKGSARIPDPRTLEMPTEETNFDYLKLPNDDDFFPCNLHRILITETYTSLYALLCEQDKLYTNLPKQKRLSSLKHSTIIAGQPGTGKTVGLSCILVWRLQEKKPTVYCSHKSYAYAFTDTGVQRVPMTDGNRIEVLDKSTVCCALVDINPDLLEVPSQFRPSLDRQGRVVVATSPNPDHVTTFKQDHARTYYTPTWKWADLYCASLVQFYDVNPETLRNAYTKLAGIPRRCFRALSDEGDAHEMEIIKSAIDNIENIEDFAKSTSGPLPFKTKASHALVRMEPTGNKWDKQITNLLSNHVADLVFDRIDLHNTLKIRDLIDSLLRNPNARSWGGKLFERAVHRAFRKGFEFEPEAMDDDAPSLLVQIKKAESEAKGYFHTLSVRAAKGSQRVGEFLNQYLIPLSSTAETIDSIDILENVTVLFQMTVSPSHSLNLKGITELTDELPALAKKRICIVFVVPDHDTTRKLYKRQNIVIPHGVPKHVSDPVVAYKQYVYYFPMDKL